MTHLQDLLAESKALEQKIANAKKAEAKTALETIHMLIAQHGFTAQQVIPWKPLPKKVSAKYQDPETGMTWTGRGKPPKWIDGKDRAAFEIRVQ